MINHPIKDSVDSVTDLNLQYSELRRLFIARWDITIDAELKINVC